MTPDPRQETKRFGKYELIKYLGGGMSDVFVARDTLIHRVVALKLLTESGANDPDTRARFIREAQLAGSVVHDNIIRVYDFGEYEGRLFMVMELLEGEDLADALKAGRLGGIPERLQIAAQIAAGMEHVHSLQIIHRDLKPQNVFLTRTGMAKLMDFGIAKSDRTSLTQAGFSLGTPAYMAPEQVLGKDVTLLADIYSFGILLYELTTGTKPLSADTVERIFWMILHEPVDVEPLRQAGASEALISLIAQLTNKDVAQRPQTFTEVRSQLDAILNPQPEQPTVAIPTPKAAPKPAPQAPAPTPAPAPASSSKGLLYGGIAAAVVVLAGLGYFFTRPKPAAPVPAATVATAPAPTLSLPSGDMILIPAGDFPYGEKKETRSTPAYYIDRDEVTVAAYAEFLSASGHTPPPDFDKSKGSIPVTNVTLPEARDFARWAGKRLPNNVEWEKAARGTDGRKYAWGSDPRTDVAIRGGVGLRPSSDTGKSFYGIREMGGNVWEWIDEKATPSPGAIQAFSNLTPKPTATEPWAFMRGGSYLEAAVEAYEFVTVPARFHAKDIGFRCAKDAN